MDGTERRGRAARGVRWPTAAAAAVLLSLVAGTARGQHPPPKLPGGVPVAVLPVQSARPAPSGAWPGGAPSLEATLEAANAELAFAFRERRGAGGWVLPDDAVERARRNPLLKVDPERLAYRLILRPPEDGRIVDPIHGQLRSLGALLGTRVVVVPLVLSYEPVAPGGPGGAQEGAERREAGAVPDSGAAGAAAEEGPRGRGSLLLAVVDTRAGRVLWHGRIGGEPAPPDSSGLLATLASKVAEALTP